MKRTICLCCHYRERGHFSFQCLQPLLTASTLVTEELEVKGHHEPQSNEQLPMGAKGEEKDGVGCCCPCRNRR